MNGIKPSFGAEFTNDYDEAKRKLIDFVIAFDKLPVAQKEQLKNEFISSATRATSLGWFLKYFCQ